ncbi:putative Non-ribosomal peptide synthetase [Streptomyces misionensis JCM 4497]
MGRPGKGVDRRRVPGDPPHRRGTRPARVAEGGALQDRQVHGRATAAHRRAARRCRRPAAGRSVRVRAAAGRGVPAARRPAGPVRGPRPHRQGEPGRHPRPPAHRAAGRDLAGRPARPAPATRRRAGPPGPHRRRSARRPRADDRPQGPRSGGGHDRLPGAGSRRQPGRPRPAAPGPPGPDRAGRLGHRPSVLTGSPSPARPPPPARPPLTDPPLRTTADPRSRAAHRKDCRHDLHRRLHGRPAPVGGRTRRRGGGHLVRTGRGGHVQHPDALRLHGRRPAPRRAARRRPRVPAGHCRAAGLGGLGGDGEGPAVLHRQQRAHLHRAVVRLHARLLRRPPRRETAVRHPRAGLSVQADGGDRPVHRLPHAARRLRGGRQVRPGRAEGPSAARLHPPSPQAGGPLGRRGAGRADLPGGHDRRADVLLPARPGQPATPRHPHERRRGGGLLLRLARRRRHARRRPGRRSQGPGRGQAVPRPVHDPPHGSLARRRPPDPTADRPLRGGRPRHLLRPDRLRPDPLPHRRHLRRLAPGPAHRLGHRGQGRPQPARRAGDHRGPVPAGRLGPGPPRPPHHHLRTVLPHPWPRHALRHPRAAEEGLRRHRHRAAHPPLDTARADGRALTARRKHTRLSGEGRRPPTGNTGVRACPPWE